MITTTWKRYHDWRDRRAQEQKENELLQLLSQMQEKSYLLLNLRRCGDSSASTQKQIAETSNTIKQGFNTLSEKLPGCSPVFQEDALARCRQMIAEMR